MAIQTTKVSAQGPGGGTLAGSGMVPFSGIISTGQTGVSSGPWRIEKQFVHIYYCREPNLNFEPFVTSQLHMNTGSPVSGKYGLHGSELSYQMYAGVHVYKSNADFPTTGYTEPQLLAISANEEDINGNTYGLVTGSGGTGIASMCLGPQGAIETIQQYYSRREWNETGDTESFNQAWGYNVAFQFGREQYTSNYHCASAAENYNTWKHIRSSTEAGSTHGVQDYTAIKMTSAPKYYISAGYATSKEHDYHIKAFIIDAIHAMSNLDSPQYYTNVPNIPVPQAVSYPTPTEAVSGLDPGRIDWS